MGGRAEIYSRLNVANLPAMKILYVNPSAQLGGAELCLLDMMSEVRSEVRGQRPHWQLVVLAPGAGPLLERAAALGVETRVLEYPQRLARLGDSGSTSGRWSGASGQWRKARLGAQLALAGPAIAGYRRRLRKVIE